MTAAHSAGRNIAGVVFDFDGTLTRPGALDFAAIRREIGCPPNESVLDHIRDTSDPVARQRKWQILDEFEACAAVESGLADGAVEVLGWIRARQLKTGILTRNSRRALQLAFRSFVGVAETDFDIIITRDDGVAPKPSPEGLFLAARHFGCATEQIAMVGDYLYDVEAGIAAGSFAVYLDNQPERGMPVPACDCVIGDIAQLPAILAGRSSDR